MAAGSEVTKDRNAGEVAKEVLDFVVKGAKGKLNDAESARVAYRNHTGKMRQNVDAVSAKADELSKAMQSAKNLKDGVKIGSQCMAIKGNVRTLAGGLQTAEAFLLDMQDVMKAGGLECDDSTVIQKLQRLDPSTIIQEGGSLVSNINSVYSFVSNVAAAVY
jgi:uncharacterized protein (DUF3084 family)